MDQVSGTGVRHAQCQLMRLDVVFTILGQTWVFGTGPEETDVDTVIDVSSILEVAAPFGFTYEQGEEARD